METQDEKIARIKRELDSVPTLPGVYLWKDADGEVIFRNTIHKIGEGKGYVPQTVPLSVVFLAKCSDCGAQIRVASAPETRLRMLCNSCAAKAFPETFYGKTAQV